MIRQICAVLILFCAARGALAEVNYDFYPGEAHNVPDFAALKPESSGTVPTFDHTLGGKAPEENYSVRFSGGLKIEKDGRFTFYLNSDDGSKLWIDDKLLVDNDGEHGEFEKSGTVALAAGAHKIVLGYFQSGGDRALKVEYESADVTRKKIPAEALTPKPPEKILPTPALPANLSYEYYEGDFSKLPDFGTLTAITKGEIDGFDPALDGKARGENYAVRYSGQIKIDKDGEYTFFTASDDGSRLLIDDKRVVDNDGDHGADEKSGKATLTVGSHKITVLYYQHGGERALTVNYAGPEIEKKPIPAGKLSK